MNKTSIASLKERLSNWHDWDEAAYELGACLGFWPEFGAPQDGVHNKSVWHGTENIFWTKNPLGKAIFSFFQALIKEGCLEKRDEPVKQFRWNPSYKGMADIVTIL